MTDFLTFTYTGPSMRPTLRPGDILTVEPEPDNLRIGDIIVFQSGNEQTVVHRIVSLTGRSVRTRGDNNCEMDPDMIDFSCLIGRACGVTRNGRTRQLCGGSFSGRCYTAVLRCIKKAEQYLVALWGTVYREFPHRRELFKLFVLLFKPRFLSFSKKEGTEVQLIIGKKIIGRYLPREKRWLIRRPFRLIIDESSLPLKYIHM